MLGNPGGDSQRIGWDDVESCGADVVIVAPCGYSLEPAVELAGQVATAGRLPAGAEVWAVDADAYVVRPGHRVVPGPSWWARSSTATAVAIQSRAGRVRSDHSDLAQARPWFHPRLTVSGDVAYPGAGGDSTCHPLGDVVR